MQLEQNNVSSSTERTVSDAKIEGIKLAYDYVKFLTTLNLASIVVLATFSERLISQGDLRFLATVALGGFSVSIVFCMITNLIYAGNAEQGIFEPPEGGAQRVGGNSFLIATVGFLIALGALVAFAAHNFFN